MLNNRYERQSDLVSSEQISNYTPIIIGCGAVGSQVAQMLSQMGSDLILVDHDTVDEQNLSCQGFRESELGMPKVEALKSRLKEFNSEISIDARHTRFRRSMEADTKVVFCCVDTMEARSFIFENVKDRTKFFVDGRTRAGAEVRVIVAEKDVKEGDPSFEHYPSTLFSDDNASPGSCTAKTTIYGAMCTASMMVSHYTRWLNGHSAICYDTMLDLVAMDSTFMV